MTTPLPVMNLNNQIYQAIQLYRGQVYSLFLDHTTSLPHPKTSFDQLDTIPPLLLSVQRNTFP